MQGNTKRSWSAPKITTKMLQKLKAIAVHVEAKFEGKFTSKIAISPEKRFRILPAGF